MTLLDSSIDYYVLKEKQWDLGSGEIYDSNGDVIGKMERRLRNIRGLTKLTEIDGRGVLKIQRKLFTYRITYDVFESHEDDGMHGKQFARCKRSFWSWFRPKMWFEYESTEQGSSKKRLDAQGSFSGWTFKIISEGKEIAEVKKLDKYRDLIFKGLFDKSDTHAIHILDKNFDRKILLGFIMAIERSLSAKK
jgi:uncharacterized protein YxjI|tara:strand:- start:338 stop:913 length:576 start_codon:yes stop_codon:yes gene_type:complete